MTAAELIWQLLAYPSDAPVLILGLTSNECEEIRVVHAPVSETGAVTLIGKNQGADLRMMQP